MKRLFAEYTNFHQNFIKTSVHNMVDLQKVNRPQRFTLQGKLHFKSKFPLGLSERDAISLLKDYPFTCKEKN